MYNFGPNFFFAVQQKLKIIEMKHIFKEYQAPAVAMTDVAVEEGFAASASGGLFPEIGGEWGDYGDDED